MDQTEIIRKINNFPRWHYQFDLKGNLTPIFNKRFINRNQQRMRYFFDPVVELLDGTLAGKRVLDLGCNAGFWSLAAIEQGCDFVLGIDGRKMHIDQANFVFEVKEIEKNRYEFIKENVFEIDVQIFGTFDLVLCLGLLYHVNKPMVLMEKIAQVNSDILIIDTHLSVAPISGMIIHHESIDDPRNALECKLVLHPTKQAIFDMIQQFGYSVVMLRPQFQNYTGSLDYRVKARRAFICAKKTNLSKLFGKREPINLATKCLDFALWLGQTLSKRRRT